MTTEARTALFDISKITRSILTLRGQRVILDKDLASIYEVETRTLNQAVKRNPDRFPEDFMFRLTREEAQFLRSQSVILKNGRSQHIKHLPYAFTEHGAIQAANVLNSPQAAMMGVYVVRVFVKLRELLISNQELAQQLKELEARLTRRLDTHDQAITGILRTIRELTHPPLTKHRPIGFTANFNEPSES